MMTLLRLGRVSNLPTVWSNVFAGLLLSQMEWGWVELLTLSLALSLVYIGGMFLNDAFDVEFDREFNPERPIPSGLISQRTVFLYGGFFLVLSILTVFVLAPVKTPALLAVLGLCALVIFYNSHHKGVSYAPLVMGLCRGSIYWVIVLSMGAEVDLLLVVASMALASYVVSLTFVARFEHIKKDIGRKIPLLIAGMCWVDALIVALIGEFWLALVPIFAFLLTLIFQRKIPAS